LAEEYQGKVVFAGVSNNDSVEAGRDYVVEFGVPYAMGHSPEIWEAFGDPYRPTTIVFDATGREVTRLIGEVTYESLKSQIEAVL
jgi:hypothetical protein